MENPDEYVLKVGYQSSLSAGTATLWWRVVRLLVIVTEEPLKETWMRSPSCQSPEAVVLSCLGYTWFWLEIPYKCSKDVAFWCPTPTTHQWEGSKSSIRIVHSVVVFVGSGACARIISYHLLNAFTIVLLLFEAVKPALSINLIVTSESGHTWKKSSSSFKLILSRFIN